MRGRAWSKKEIEFLQEHVGSDEIREIIRIFLKQWPDRESDAILTKIKRLGISRIPIDGGWNCRGLADILGCDRDRVHDWISRRLLKTKRRSGRRNHRIFERDFVRFATEYPEWLKDISSDRLAILLPNSVTQKISASPDRTRGVRFKIRSQRTGMIYQSLRQAEKKEFLSRHRMAELVKSGRSTRDGSQFELIQRGR